MKWLRYESSFLSFTMKWLRYELTEHAQTGRCRLRCKHT